MLRGKVPEYIDTLEANIILMLFGCFGNGLVGIKFAKATLIIPRIDDCITMLLGSTETRRNIPDEASTFFLTKDWLNPVGI
ncbi:hypothetical protein SpAn4DRAFT_2246 [Sporomusa ovata]|uniref:DUF1638 domain-containing protein n=2 Tax=Sporomusa ovata TaxID=2378 RepID=A0A0U1L286_9FIRM|nr:hypothetical protein SpAn4DRAFT_2246 [Sporomusa ovata]